ncbi:MAG: WG repeat-containing protein [Oscillospiraceae bacterium]|jgi:hypothetical protein|nr:WG repeat-containing protein [Oscillospiraceae bacterium]
MKKFFTCICVCAVLSASCGKSAPLPEPADTSDITNASELADPPDPANPALSSVAERLSALEPYETRSEVIDYYFPEEGGLSEFVPADYGRLYPFPACTTFSNYDSYGISSTGLMTADGKIVVDGIYSGARFYDADDGYYILQTALSPERVGISDYATEDTVITADGKYTAGPYYASEVRFAGDYLITVREPRDDNRSFIRYIDIRSGDVVSSGEYENFYAGGGVGGVYYRSLDGGDDISTLPEGAEVELLPDGRLGVYVKYNPETHPQMQLNMWNGDCYVVCELSEDIFVRAGDDAVAITDKSGELYWRSGASVYINGHFLAVDNEVFDLEMNALPGFDWFVKLTDSLYAFRSGESKSEVRDIKTGKSVFTSSPYLDIIMVAPDRFLAEGVVYDMDGNSERVFPENAAYYRADGGDLFIVSIYDEKNPTVLSGLYTATGEEVLPIKYKALYSLGDGLYSVSIDDYMGVINEKVEWLVKIDMLKFKD